MTPTIVDSTVEELRKHGRALLAAAVLALAPALALTALIEVFASSDGAIVNGRLVPDEAASGWTTFAVSASVGAARLQVAIPVLVALGWLVTVAVGLRLIGGDRWRSAWRQAAAGAVAWLLLALLLGAAATAAMFVTTAVGAAAGWLALFAALAFTYGLARLALALPALLIDGYDVVTALRRAVAVTRGRTLVNGTAMLFLGVGLPWVALWLAGMIGRGLESTAGSGAAVVWIGSLLRDLALIATTPLPVAALAAAYRVAVVTSEQPGRTAEATSAGELSGGAAAGGARNAGVPATAPATAIKTRPAMTVGVLALLVVASSAIPAAVVAANPRHLPEASIAHPLDGFQGRPLVLTVLRDGTTAAVDSMQVAMCDDERCATTSMVTMPCRDGGQPEPVGGQTRSCSSEGPVRAADLTPDGTLLALSRGPHNRVRLFWCRLAPKVSQMCQWGGAATLYQMPERWENWSMAVAATPDGGLAAAFVGPDAAAGRGQVLLATCASLDCPQPTVRRVLDVALPEGWQGAGEVDLAIDRFSGALALGYDDPHAGLWLGGCPAACPDGPVLTEIRSFTDAMAGGHALPRRSLDVVATATGPIAIATELPSEPDPFRPAALYICADLACTTEHWAGANWKAAWPLVDHAGNAFIAGNLAGDQPVLLDVRTTGGPLDIREVAPVALLGEGTVMAAAYGPDGRLRVVLRGPDGPTVVVCVTTCALP